MRRPESRAYTLSMAERVRDVAPDDAPPVDPHAVSARYRRAKAKRRARVKRRRATKWAGFRFWLVLLALVAASVVIVVVILREVEQLFGL
jgi:anti-sigma-K factor RskA